MNIDELTLGQAKQLAAMLKPFDDSVNAAKHPMVGKHCIARCYTAGVHAGIVSHVDGENVILVDSRRLWSWKAADGIALSGVAQHGIASGKLDVVNPLIYLTGVCELIPISTKAMESINAYK
jgi:hypothetical protein